MITCHVRNEIDPSQIEAFERFARRWMQLVQRHGGSHHGYFLPDRRRVTGLWGRSRDLDRVGWREYAR
jgi:hypothetical protein